MGLFLLICGTLLHVLVSPRADQGTLGTMMGSVIERLSSPRQAYAGLNLVILAGTALVATRWVACCWTLPHRYQWRARFYRIYFLWGLAVSLPAYMWVGHIWRHYLEPLALTSPFHGAEEGSVVINQNINVAGVVAGQVLCLLLLTVSLTDWQEPASDEEYETLPSTHYENLSETACFHGAVKRYRFWTWATFCALTLWFCLSLLYLMHAVVGSSVGPSAWFRHLSGLKYWPPRAPVQSYPGSAPALMLICLMGTPLVLTLGFHIRSLTRLSRKWKLSSAFAQNPRALGMPVEALECLGRELRATSIRVFEIPEWRIMLSVERTAFFRKDYILWVSVGTMKRLSRAEMEAMLWHECGHANILRRSTLRHIAAILAPWGPRFTDLAEDLYKHEREADNYAGGKIGTLAPLISALHKLKEQENLPNEAANHLSREDVVDWFPLTVMRRVWNQEWVGYLHPDASQRLQWLEYADERRTFTHIGCDRLLTSTNSLRHTFDEDE